ncbi:MAG: SRPBCC domain-containing protein [Saprospiraceae bacterium]|nr:SRPBCC domain-containing protein [Pyrinomonadaceae bacterium]
MTATANSQTNELEIVITREFNASRELLWDLWTEPKHMEKWFGPAGFTTKVTEVDFKPGGVSRYVMIGPDGKEYPGKGVFREIVRPERIVSTDEFGDDFDAGGADLPKGMILTALFDDLGEKTRLTLRISHPTPEDRKKHEDMGVVAGWNSSLDKLDEYLVEIQ